MTGIGGEMGQDTNEARRAGDWEMALSTSKSTGDWCVAAGGGREGGGKRARAS